MKLHDVNEIIDQIQKSNKMILAVSGVVFKFNPKFYTVKHDKNALVFIKKGKSEDSLYLEYCEQEEENMMRCEIEEFNEGHVVVIKFWDTYCTVGQIELIK